MPRRLNAAMPAAIIAAVIAAGGLSAAAHAQAYLDETQSVTFIDIVAERGLECGLIRPWQSAALRAQAADARKRWDAERRAAAAESLTTKLGETDCDNTALRAWTDAVGPNFEREMLPHFLVAYRAMALQDEPLMLFQYLARRRDAEADAALIDAHFAELEASGVLAEGQKTWPEFIENMTGFVDTFSTALRGESDDDEAAARFSADEAAAWLSSSILVSELWLEDETADAGASE